MRPAIIMLALLALAGCALAGCDRVDPYKREGIWRPMGANDANLRAMVTVPSDLVAASRETRADGGRAAAALVRLRNDRVRPLPASGISKLVAVGDAPAPPPAAPAAVERGN